jgi:CRISPR/Cas system-associated exonuclease Cas4 (RecB family)
MKKAIEETEQLKESIINAIESQEFPKEPRTTEMCHSCQYRIYCKY